MKTLFKTLMLAVFIAALFAGMTLSPVAAAACGDTYTVQKGDYLTKIAKNCGVTYDSLLKANPEIKNPDKIYVGQVIRIKAGANLPGVPVTGTQEYVVARGDTLAKIANRFGTTVSNLMKLNPDIKDPNKIYVGQRIRVPSGSTGSSLVTVSATSLKAGEQVEVRVKGFPANAEIDFRLGKDGEAYRVALDGKTDANGEATGKLTIPTSAAAGEKWVVEVLTTGLTNGKSAKSSIITIK